MRVFHFSEQPYPAAWDHHEGSLRVNLPNRYIDPKVAADLYHRYYDEWQLCDELGLDIMINEHHATATCMSATAVVSLSILARITQKARLLVLGYPIANRPDPLRAAEELATVDVISRGRLEMGFVKGVPMEVPVANMNPVFLMDRFWESHDFIIKAMTSHDEPFNWEGEHFQYRHVNLWPRPYQQPHPPVWGTTGTPATARVLAQKDHVLATLATGYRTRSIFDAYRNECVSLGRSAPGPERFAYLAYVAVGETEAEARRLGELVLTYPRTSGIVHEPFRNPPGFQSVDLNVRMMRGEAKMRGLDRAGNPVNQASDSVQALIDAGVLFCGTPDQVHDQIAQFVDHCGGLGNLLMMGQAGSMSHADTVGNLTLFAEEVLPRLTEINQPDPQTMAELTTATSEVV
ncbi:MAG: alkanesulfonate monooxygenase SsuD [Verrucomicrobiales bacterium]|jgi:alkanesulfonate monooxygenase SsuD/methylene tetrahydromethanopterin reductase-like flavin-dependent oxidoreductase (luciferase family)